MKPKLSFIHKAGAAIKKASPTILTCVGAVGIIATSVLTAKATPKALECIKEAKESKNGEELTAFETVKACAPCYIPAAVTGIAAIGCVFGANILNKRQQASLASAYALLNRSYNDYKNKLKELYGQEAHDRIIKELAVEKTDPNHYIQARGGFYISTLDFEGATEEKRLFYDRLSERYFESTIGKVLQAEYHLNRNLSLRGDVTLNDFYSFLGIDPVPEGNCVGWYIDDEEIYWIDFNHPYMPIDDGPSHEPIDVWVIDPVFDPRSPSENW